MTYRQLFPLSGLLLLLLLGCGGSSEVSFSPTAGAEMSPSPIMRTTRTPAVLTARPLGTTAIRTVVPTGPPPTPTSTSEPLPSATLSRAARELDDKLDDFRAAVRDGDNQRALNLQRELLADAEKAEQIARADKTKYGEQMLGALVALRAGLGGDLARLDGARAELRKIGGRFATPSGTPGTDSTVQPIDDLQVFAAGLADKVSSFRKAMERNDTGALLALQSELLAEMSRVEAQARDSRSKQAELIRSALGDIRGGISGETGKLATAEAKLREAAGQSFMPTQTVYPTTATPVTTATSRAIPSPSAEGSGAGVRQMAGELRGKLDEFERALKDTNNPQNLDRVRRELQDQLGRVENTMKNNNSQQAGQLRTAIGQIREAMGGDTAKIEPARRTLDRIGS